MPLVTKGSWLSFAIFIQENAGVVFYQGIALLSVAGDATNLTRLSLKVTEVEKCSFSA